MQEREPGHVAEGRADEVEVLADADRVGIRDVLEENGVLVRAVAAVRHPGRGRAEALADRAAGCSAITEASSGTTRRSSWATMPPKRALPSSSRCVWSTAPSGFTESKAEAAWAPSAFSRSMLRACRSTSATAFSPATARVAAA